MADSAILGQKATNNVAIEINELYNSTQEVAVAIDELVKNSGEISEIITFIGGIADQTTLLEVAKSAKHMAVRNGEVIKAIGSIAAISEESSASVEEISATSEEQSSLVDEVTILAQNLSEIAGNLRESVEVFEIENKDIPEKNR